MGTGWRRASMEAFLAEREASLRSYAYAVTGGDTATSDKVLEHALGVVFSRGRRRLPIDQAEREVRLIVAKTFLRRDGRRRRRSAIRQLLQPHRWKAEARPFTAEDATVDALSTIGPRERVCLLRYVLDGRTIGEIVREFDLSPERVRSGLSEAIAVLDARLGPLGEIDFDSVPVAHRSAT